jgi:hypothetical protein
MPRTLRKATPELAIRLQENLISFSPGDTIIGEVVRAVHTVSTRARITVKLHGRAKSKLTVHRSNGSNRTTSHYRGRFNFFLPYDTTQTLFDGPVHIPPEGGPQAWQFALTIPKKALPRSVKAGNYQDRSYLPLNDDAIAASSLPSTFEFENLSMWGPDFHCYVEYYLEAEFRQENGGHLSTAAFPILLVTDSTRPFKSCNLRPQTIPGCIKTQRLIPGMENAELSFRQKTQKFFHSSAVPQYSFNIHVHSPTIIKMQSPISFKIRIVPNRGQTGDTVGPQTIALTSLAMELKSATSVICEGSLSPHTASGIKEHNFANKETVLGLRSPITVPSDPDAEALDIGALVQISLDSQRSTAGGKHLYQLPRVYPDFITYNIKHSHSFNWELRLEVAGETVKASGAHPVTILAAG